MLLMLVFTSLSLSAQSNRGLSFDSLNHDFASADPGVYPVPSFADATIEFWVYVPVAEDTVHYFISQGTPGTSFYIGYDGRQSNHLLMGDAWTNSNVSLPIGQWTHIALAISGGDFQAYLYLNGRMVDSTHNDYFTCDGAGTQLQLGTGTGNTSFFTGKLDQVRIWTVTRTADEIKAGMYGAVSPSTANLYAYYKMDEASGSTTANSTATTGADLTLFGSPARPFIPIQASNNALTFDVTNNTQVDMAPDSANLTTGTVEAWLQPGSLSNESAFLSNSGSGGSHFTMTLDNSSGNKRIGIYNTTDGVHYIDYPAGFTANKWYHVALVTAPAASGDTTALYVNGVYIANTPFGYDNAVLNQPLHIGSNGVDFTQHWQGSIDEVRIWKVALTQAQIAANIGISLTGNETDLLSVWSFDQGIPDGDNTGLRVAVDNAPLTNNGTLSSSFALTSASASNFSLHNIVLPVTLARFTVSKQGSSALLQWQTAQEENTKDFIIERSTNGIDFTDIGSTPAAGNSHGLLNYAFLDNAPVEGRNYYRLKERDLDLTPTYSEVKVLSFTRTGNLVWYSTGANSVEIRLQKGSTELYTISNRAGNVIRTGRLSDGKTSLSQVPAGIYFVKVINTIGDELTSKILIP